LIIMRPFQSSPTAASLTEEVRSALGRRLKDYPWTFQACVEGSVLPLTQGQCMLSVYLVDRASGSVVASFLSRDRLGDARRMAESFAASAEAAFCRFSARPDAGGSFS
jgi:hypothetical protein